MATILYGIDAFIWYFCRKRRVTWVGWYYEDGVWEIPPKGDEEKENLAENEEEPEDDPPKYDDEMDKAENAADEYADDAAEMV